MIVAQPRQDAYRGFLWAAEPLIALFTNDPAVRALGAQCLRVVSYGYAFYAWGMVLVLAFNGAGDTATPAWINLGCYWCFQFPLALLLAQTLGHGPLGVRPASNGFLKPR